MSFPTHILVATDFSDASDAALARAAGLARALGARVTILHVYDPDPQLPHIALARPNELREQLAKEMADGVRAKLEETRREALAGVPKVAVVAVQARSAADAICAKAAEVAADLVVVGSHGRTGLTHLLIGSVAERVVRHSPAAVLTVPPRSR